MALGEERIHGSQDVGFGILDLFRCGHDVDTLYFDLWIERKEWIVQNLRSQQSFHWLESIPI